uniref:Uncharacterized protein n=1 Tax=Anguilla anguilla TaxID=7936 RepID=A0A0E9PZC9_ANGAN
MKTIEKKTKNNITTFLTQRSPTINCA